MSQLSKTDIYIKISEIGIDGTIHFVLDKLKASALPIPSEAAIRKSILNIKNKKDFQSVNKNKSKPSFNSKLAKLEAETYIPPVASTLPPKSPVLIPKAKYDKEQNSALA